MLLKNFFRVRRRPGELAPAATGFCEADRVGLFEDILKQNLRLRVTVTGGSMHPVVSSGDVVTIVRTPAAALRAGDLIFYRDRRGMAVVHRLLKRPRSDRLWTKGDALLGDDPGVSVEQLMGRLTRIEKMPRPGIRVVWELGAVRWRLINRIVAVLFRCKLFLTEKIQEHHP